MKQFNQFQSCDSRSWTSHLSIGIWTIVSFLLFLQIASAQRPNLNKPGSFDLQHGRMPTGQIGQERMLVRPEMVGYMQPVRFMLPKGAEIAVWDGKEYQKLDSDKPQARMMVGAVYRLKLTGIPTREGQELFPSIEIINRLYPPAGEADRFPVMVQIQDDEMIKALDGKFVKRVTYLEDPETALPAQQVKGDQSYFQVGAGQDVLRVAASLGRPMTIVRIGSRIPLASQDAKFGLGRAPFQIIGKRSKPSRNVLSNRSKMPDRSSVPSDRSVLSDRRQQHVRSAKLTQQTPRSTKRADIPIVSKPESSIRTSSVKPIPTYTLRSEALSTKQASTFVPTPRTVVNPYYQSSVPSQTSRRPATTPTRKAKNTKVRYNPYEEVERLKRLQQQRNYRK